MNKLQEHFLKQMINGDPELLRLFERYVMTMGHTEDEAVVIVESIVNDRKLLTETKLSEMSRFKR